MKIQDFDFDLPPELIAQFPPEKRGNSRMLHLDAISGALQDRMFADLPLYLRPGDVIVFNDTRVIKARMYGVRDTGGRVEVLVERVLDRHRVLAAIRASHSPKPGSKLFLADAIEATVVSREYDFYTLQFEYEGAVIELLERYGNLPLPPYISRSVEKSDELRYQTIYATRPGAVAAPTAGLHFDEHMLGLLRKMDVVMTYVTLHVGSGTFRPVRVENIADHRMHSEVFYVSTETVECIEHAKAKGGRVLAVGTTSLRALEAAAASAGGRAEADNGEDEAQIKCGAGETDIFITPGYQFRVVDCLLTNFHLPRSTLLMLVSAFGGVENIRRAYRYAINEHYRFFSFGDAMLIEKAERI